MEASRERDADCTLTPDPRLQDAVSLGHDAEVGINDGAVERMSHGANHAVRRAPRKLRIGVQRDDVLRVRQRAQVAGLHRKRIKLALEQLVEIQQLAALALPAHPNALARVKDAMAVEQEERSRSCRGIPLIQLVGELNGQIDQRVRVVLPRARDRVGKISEQAKVDVQVLVGQVADLELVEQLAHLLLFHQQRGDHD